MALFRSGLYIKPELKSNTIVAICTILYEASFLKKIHNTLYLYRGSRYSAIFVSASSDIVRPCCWWHEF